MLTYGGVGGGFEARASCPRIKAFVNDCSGDLKTMKISAALALSLSAGMLATAQATADIGPQLELPATVIASMRGIDAHRIAEHVRFLADDLLEGRAPGTRGGGIAANYIAAQFALYGLKPAGDNGSLLHKVEFVGAKTLLGTSASWTPGQGAALALKLGEDYVAGNQTQTSTLQDDAPT